MTQTTPTALNTEPQNLQNGRANSLSAAIKLHLEKEKASFHSPGHKGKAVLDVEFGSSDLTELPGLDELSAPKDVLANLQKKASKLWQARESYISVNGASAALSAAILASASLNPTGSILLPRNLHRSAVSALVMSGLTPVWFEPSWDSDWALWQEVLPETIKAALANCDQAPVAVLINSPTYAGKLSAIKEIAQVCRSKNILLIVDEAHGAHLPFTEQVHNSALESGADLVIHSLHKTLAAPTQTGILHAGNHCPLSPSSLQSAINLLQSSSPSYSLMLGIEQALNELENNYSIAQVSQLAAGLRAELGQIPNVEIFGSKNSVDLLHLLFRINGFPAAELSEALLQRGIFCEAVLGNGVLLMLGSGSCQSDCSLVVSAIKEIASQFAANTKFASAPKPVFAEQALNPRQAFFLPSELVKVKDSVGRISSDWLAPCPPGIPVLVPGQRISQDIFAHAPSFDNLRVIMDS